jgi:DNA-binding CsgD family transcriptional regulator
MRKQPQGRSSERCPGPTLSCMAGADELAVARKAYAGNEWQQARAAYAAAAAQAVLEPYDLELFARTALLTGDDETYVNGLAQASRAWADHGNLLRAAECACYAALNLIFRGEGGPAGGWLARAQELLSGDDTDCAAKVLLHGMRAVPILQAGDGQAAYELFAEALAIANRCSDPSSAAMAAIGLGQSLVAVGRVAEGMARLDDMMLSVIAGEVNPIVSGIAYCAVIGACQEAFDPKRAGDWTRALSRWCESQPDLVPFRGQCLVHRAQIMQLRGYWPDAMEQIGEACAQLSAPPGHPAVGAAYYEQAELNRLRGDLGQADRGYVLAGQYGKETQPGLALLRLAQGRLDAGRAGITRALAETPAGPSRASLLAAAVDIGIAAGDLDSAQSAAAELTGIADALDSVLLTALAAQATGAVLIARGDPTGALPVLRRSWNAWQEVDAPYFAARVRVLVGKACRGLGDLDAARMELDAARAVFDRLGADPDLQALRNVGGGPTRQRQPGGLTAREIQVLQLVASGKTNRTIGVELFLSEKTVARHVANIFTKLRVSSRAAATAYAYEHDLMERT